MSQHSQAEISKISIAWGKKSIAKLSYNLCMAPIACQHDKSKLVYVKGQLCFPLQPGQSPGGYAGAPVQRLEW